MIEAVRFKTGKKSSPCWTIQGIDSTTPVFFGILPGNLSENEITAIVQRLACRRLTDSGIVGVSLHKPKRSTLLEVTKGGGGPNARFTIFTSGAVDHIAAYWKTEEELPESVRD